MDRFVLILFLFAFVSILTGIRAADNFVFPTDDEDKTDEVDSRYGGGGGGGFGYPVQLQNFNQKRPSQRQRHKMPNFGQPWMNFVDQQSNFNQGSNFGFRQPNFQYPQWPNNQQFFNQQRPNQGWGNFNGRRPNGQWNNQNNQNFNPQNQNFNPQSQNFNPQNQNFNQNNNREPQPQQQSPQVQACVEACTTQTPGQYDPVCGSNGMTYQNRQRYDCVVDCGEDVQISSVGSCPRPTLPPWSPSGPELLGLN